MKRKLASIFLATLVCLTPTPIVKVYATDISSESYSITNDMISKFQEYGIDSELLSAALNSRDVAASEYIIAYYCHVPNAPTPDLNHELRIVTDNYYSSNLTPYTFMQDGHTTSFVNVAPYSWISESIVTSGTGYKKHLVCDAANWYGSGYWSFAGLFTKTGNGSAVLGETPTGSSPITGVRLTTYAADGSETITWVTPNADQYVSYRVAQLGDITGDGFVNVSDAVLQLRIISNDPTFVPTDVQKLAADVNGDQSFTSEDSTLLLKYTVGQITSFFDNFSYYYESLDFVGGSTS